MNILITGGTGFVGSHLTRSLKNQGHHVFILTRSVDKHESKDSETYIGYDQNVENLPYIYAVINLAGDSLFGYWTESKKESIIKSRIETTKKVIEIMEQMKQKPDVFISGSAVGFYGMSDEVIFTEKTREPGNDFLSEVAVKWEKEARAAEKMSIRTVYTRFGVILGSKGALPLMSLPVKLGAGGKIGDGDQWISWVHVKDVVNMIIFAMDNKDISGPLNVTSPHPSRNKDFMKSLAKALKRPYWFPTPAPLIKLVMGDLSQLIVNGQCVQPAKALNQGYEFSFPFALDAFRDINK